MSSRFLLATLLAGVFSFLAYAQPIKQSNPSLSSGVSASLGDVTASGTISATHFVATSTIRAGTALRLGTATSYPFQVSVSNAGDWAGAISNTNTTNGYGLLIVGGADTVSAFDINDRLGNIKFRLVPTATANNVNAVFGGGGAVVSTASVVFNGLPISANAGAYFGGSTGFGQAADGLSAIGIRNSNGGGYGIDMDASSSYASMISRATGNAGDMVWYGGATFGYNAFVRPPTNGVSVKGNLVIGGGLVTASTFTASTGGLALSGPLTSASFISAASKTAAQLEAITPTAAGQIYYCSDCSNSVHVVVSTGSAVCQFDSFTGGTAWH